MKTEKFVRRRMNSLTMSAIRLRVFTGIDEPFGVVVFVHIDAFGFDTPETKISR